MAVERKALVKKEAGIIAKVANFFNESWQELKKVSWPTKAEVKNFTMVVIAAVFFVGLCLFIFDTILSTFTRSLFTGR